MKFKEEKKDLELWPFNNYTEFMLHHGPIVIKKK